MSWEHDLLHVELVMVTDGNMAWCAMTMACPCMTCHVWTRDVLPWPWHHVHVWHVMEFAWKTCHACVIIHVQGDMGGFWAGRSGGGFSIKKVVASILTNFFMRTIFGITYPHRKNGHAAETHQLFFFLIYSKYKYKYIYIYIPQSNFGVNGWTKLNF